MGEFCVTMEVIHIFEPFEMKSQYFGESLNSESLSCFLLATAIFTVVLVLGA